MISQTAAEGETRRDWQQLLINLICNEYVKLCKISASGREIVREKLQKQTWAGPSRHSRLHSHNTHIGLCRRTPSHTGSHVLPSCGVEMARFRRCMEVNLDWGSEVGVSPWCAVWCRRRADNQTAIAITVTVYLQKSCASTTWCMHFLTGIWGETRLAVNHGQGQGLGRSWVLHLHQWWVCLTLDGSPQNAHRICPTWLPHPIALCVRFLLGHNCRPHSIRFMKLDPISAEGCTMRWCMECL